LIRKRWRGRRGRGRRRLCESFGFLSELDQADVCHRLWRYGEADNDSLLRNQLDADQARRFDAFQTAVIPKQAIKRVSSFVLSHAPPPGVGSLISVGDADISASCLA
jgi:hypothetical protein